MASVEMNNCLMIMQAREVPECMKALRALRIRKVWFTGYTEKDLESPINSFIASTHFDNYLICSDDSISEQASLDAVTEALGRFPIVTGWSNMSPTDDRANVMLKRTFAHPFIARFLDVFVTTSKEIQGGPRMFRTYFSGFSLLGMRRGLWLKYPFRAWSHPLNRRGFGSDYLMSKRLVKDGHRIICLRDGFMYHTARDDHWLVGKVQPHTTFEPL